MSESPIELCLGVEHDGVLMIKFTEPICVERKDKLELSVGHAERMIDLSIRHVDGAFIWQSYLDKYLLNRSDGPFNFRWASP